MKSVFCYAICMYLCNGQTCASLAHKQLGGFYSYSVFKSSPLGRLPVNFDRTSSRKGGPLRWNSKQNDDFVEDNCNIFVSYVGVRLTYPLQFQE
jgi:hypothetical protein